MNLGDNICYNILTYAWRNNIDVVDREVSTYIFTYGNRILFYQTSDEVSIIFVAIRNAIEDHYSINHDEYN